MILTALLLSAITFNPAMAPLGYTEGYLQAQPLVAEATCDPGHICASKKTTLHGCFVENFYNGTNGGTPLTIDVTETGAAGSTTYVYWINSYYKAISIKGYATAKFYCPRLR